MSELLGNIPWKRFWIPRDTAPVLDRGYLADPEEQYGRIVNPHAKTLEELDDKPCVALLGEPGIGKSYVVGAYGAALLDREPAGTVLVVDCRWQRNLQEDVFATESFQAWLAGRAPLTLVVDSLDEHPKGAHEAAFQLLAKLKRGPVASLRLRIACRTAEWPATLDEQLPLLWNANGTEPRAVFYTLAPLRRIDVEQAGQAAGADATLFLEQIGQRGVEPLAMKPITLEFLLGEYRGRGALPPTREELYRNGCTRLCDETSRSREDTGRVGVLQPEQRFAIASRIAAVCILCRRSFIHRGPLRGSIADEAVRLADLVGGTEPTPLGDVEVTAEALAEVLKVSGFFASRGAEYVGWAHQTYAEFLAACFLRARRLSTEEALRELSNATMGRTVPALREAASWWASMEKGAFNALLAKDPEALLGSDFAILGHVEQEALVGALLRGIDRREVPATSILYHRDLSPRLAHPGLAAQLRPYIVERNHYVMARRAAIDIATECRLDTLEDVLADLALDPTETVDVREAAARAVCRFASRSTKLRLKPLIAGGCGADLENALKGYALEALWPRDLTAAELFASLTPPNDEGRGGSYTGFLHELEERLASDALVEALRWTKTLPARHGDQLSIAFGTLLEGILSAGWWHIHDERVRPALAEAVRQRLVVHDHIFECPSYRGDRNPDVEHDDARRHLLVSALIALPPSSGYDAFSYADKKLILPRDVPWVIEQMRAGPSSEERARWASILAYVAGRNWTFEIADPIIAALPDVRELREAMPSVSEPFVQLGSALSRRMRKDVRQQRKLAGRWRHKRTHHPEKKKRRPSVKRFIRHAIRRFGDGDLELGWRLQYALSFAPDRKIRSHERDWDITEYYGWQNADDETRGRVLEIARQYLLRERERIAEWLGGQEYYSTRAGYRYLCLLEKLDPAWLDAHADAVWASWAGVTLVYSINPSADTQRMVSRAYRSQPARMLEVLGVLLLKQNERFDYPQAIFHLSAGWDKTLGRFLLDFVGRYADLKPRFMGEVLDELIHTGAKAPSNTHRLCLRQPSPPMARGGSARVRRPTRSWHSRPRAVGPSYAPSSRWTPRLGARCS